MRGEVANVNSPIAAISQTLDFTSLSEAEKLLI